ncbi:MAG TPA: glycosyltransferase family 39 protein [Candidatus Binataceae bacterium]|nr:glycosyltransferase family 39 protein [Candidatus Binataceae bacterium]
MILKTGDRIGPTEAARWRWAGLAVLAMAALLFFVRLGSRALWSSEFRWAEIAREMILTHNYFWPTINGKIYYDKPLGSYWLVVASTYLTGSMNELAARLPCAIAGLLAVGLLILLARRLYDFRTGVIAAFVFATSYSFVFFSRHASADVETVTGELAALLLFLPNEENPRGWWVIALWLIMAVTSLTKGLLGFVLPLTVIGGYSCLADGWAEMGRRLLGGPIAERARWLIERNRWFFNWRTPFAIAIAGAVYYAPFAISQARTGSEHGLYMVYRENVERYFEPFDHRGPIYLYVYVIFALMAPWSAFLPAALAETHLRRRAGAENARADRFTLVFFWGTFIFFTLSGSRRSYYLLPILPAGAILIAQMLATPMERLAPIARRLMIAGFVVIAVVVAAAALGFVPPRLFLPQPYSALPRAPEIGVFALCWIASIAAVIYALRGLSSQRIAAASAIIAYLFMIYFFVFAMPAADAWRGEKPFALEVSRIIDGNADKLAFYRVVGPVFYMKSPKPVPEYDNPRALQRAVSQGAVKWIVVRRRDLDHLRIPAEIVATETVYPWDPREHRLNTMVLERVGAPK